MGNCNCYKLKRGCRVSGPQGKVEPLTIIDDPSAWKSSDFKGNEQAYQYSFTESDIAELKAAVTGIDSRGMATNENIQKVRLQENLNVALCCQYIWLYS